jgi:hypothetical protein
MHRLRGAMSKRLKIPDFPAMLMRTGIARAGLQDAETCIDLLAGYYKLPHPPRNLSPGVRASEVWWRCLALNLASDFIPAFQEPARRGRSAHGAISDWQIASGLSSGDPTAQELRRFYQAQLVEVISDRMRKAHKPRSWVFKWFANEIEKVDKRRAEERRRLLPSIYRKRTTSGSLRQAFNSIPRSVRQNPSIFLPPRGLGLVGAFVSRRPATGLAAGRG